MSEKNGTGLTLRQTLIAIATAISVITGGTFVAKTGYVPPGAAQGAASTGVRRDITQLEKRLDRIESRLDKIYDLLLKRLDIRR